MGKLVEALMKHFTYADDTESDRYYCPLCKVWAESNHARDCPVAIVEEMTGKRAARLPFGEVAWR